MGQHKQADPTFNFNSKYVLVNERKIYFNTVFYMDS